VGPHVTGARRYPRTARLNEAMLEVLADTLERMSDPRLELVTLTGVEVSRDLSHATVFYSTLGAETAPDAPKSVEGDASAGLTSAAPHLRGVLGRAMRIRQVPKLVFRVDPAIVSGQRIEEILRGIRHSAQASEEASDAGGEEEER
jgi:ribosome-binding factor A